MESPLILVVNPGSASRKYALYRSGHYMGGLHFEYTRGKVACTLDTSNGHKEIPTTITDIGNASRQVIPLLRNHGVLSKDERIARIGLRIVAPSSFFLRDHIITNEIADQLQSLVSVAPIHIAATLHELASIQDIFSGIEVIGVSDSAFHATKPDRAWNYGINLHDADTHDIKRFGYHGISAASVTRRLAAKTSHQRIVIAHIGSGVSVTAVYSGKSLDTTMGYSPLEGAIMSTRSGSIDTTAVHALQSALNLDDAQIETYLNKHGGLLGLGGSADVRELLIQEADGNHAAKLALDTYVYGIRKLIGQMSAALEGIDALVFTGTIGERSAPIRGRLLRSFDYLGLTLDDAANARSTSPTKPTKISSAHSLKPIYIIPADEASEIAQRAATFSNHHY
jgi:acetate kinase